MLTERHPLFLHRNGQWSKKVNGKMRYFGTDKNAALKRWLDERDALLAGREPREAMADSPTVRDLANKFLASKDALIESSELSPRTRADYKQVCIGIVDTFGALRPINDLTPGDFEKLRSFWAVKWGPKRLGNFINYTRTVFRYAYDDGMIAAPMRFGATFKKPSAAVMRRHRASKPKQLFTPDEIHRLLDAAGQSLRAMIYLGLNCGFGNTDVGRLQRTALDLDVGWVEFARPKTGIERRCPLWPETVTALRDWLATCKESPYVFLNSRGNVWINDPRDRALSRVMGKLLRKVGLSKGRNFYALRHTFETVAGQTKDQVAVDALMGHVDGSMSAMYREEIDDARLVAVTEHIRRWLKNTP